MPINENLMNIANDVNLMSDEEFSNKMKELQTIEKDCLFIGIPFPIDSRLEMLYLETGKKILEMLK